MVHMLIIGVCLFVVRNGINFNVIFLCLPFGMDLTESKPDLLSKVATSSVSTTNSSVHNSDSSSVISCNTPQKIPGKLWYANTTSAIWFYTVSPKKRPTLSRSITSPKINRFSQYFHCCILWTISD